MSHRYFKPFFSLIILLVAALLLQACNMPGGGNATPTNVVDAISTLAAQTAAARLTSEPPAQPTSAITIPPPATATPQATNTPVPPTATPIPCNRAEFVSDVNYPDNTQVPAGSGFSKTWRLKNTGSCTWTSGYQVIFDKGDRMGAPDYVAATTGTVPPGGTVDISVSLVAPAAPGTFRGDFLMRAADGARFGIGPGGTGNFWVQIVVPAPTATPTTTPTLMLLIIKTPLIIAP